MTSLPPASDPLPALERALTPPLWDALQRCRRLCQDQDASLFLVGGALRDLLLGRPNLDIDLALEFEVATIATALAAETAGRATLHSRFGTATVSGPGFHLDLARTRRETYSRPGALPDVEPASIEADLARRDFTVNDLALRLTEPGGQLLDPSNGRADLAAGLIRVLHDRSFQDDATRMLRALRYAARLGFALEPDTEAWLRRDLSYLDAVSGPRLRRELVLLFEESEAPTAALEAERLGILAALHPALSLTPEVAQRWQRALLSVRHANIDELGFCLLAANAPEPDIDSLSARLHLSGRFEKALRDFVRLRPLSDKLASATAPEAIEMLEGLAPAAVWALSLTAAGRTTVVCGAYLGQWRHVKPLLNGSELQELGVADGPETGRMLKELRMARIRGQVQTREDEVALVLGQRP